MVMLEGQYLQILIFLHVTISLYWFFHIQCVCTFSSNKCALHKKKTNHNFLTHAPGRMACYVISMSLYYMYRLLTILYSILIYANIIGHLVGHQHGSVVSIPDLRSNGSRFESAHGLGLGSMGSFIHFLNALHWQPGWIWLMMLKGL